MSYNWGIIGPGKIAHTFATALQASQRGRLYAVASRDHKRGADFASRFGCEVVYDDYKNLIADDKVDVIYIATPHSHHFPVARLVLEAGKHLLLEKPVTVNAAQTGLLVALSKANNCVFQEALWSRFMPCFERIKQWLDEDRIGSLQYITSQIGFAFAGQQDHRLNNPELAGGSLLDLGVYSVSISQFLLSQHPQNVQAMSQLSELKVDRTTCVNMQYPDGVMSQFTSTIGGQCTNIMTIHGDRGYIEIPGRFWEGKSVNLYIDGKQTESIRFEHQVNGFEYQIEATMELISKGLLSDSRMSHEDSVGVMKTLDTVRQQIDLQYDQSIESL